MVSFSYYHWFTCRECFDDLFDFDGDGLCEAEFHCDSELVLCLKDSNPFAEHRSVAYSCTSLHVTL